jgi:hypothetical protein
MDTISARAGRVVNIEAIHELYRPILQHTFTDADDGERHNVYRIEIDGVTIRYVESMFDVQMTVEGPLSNSLSESLAQDVCRKLSELEGIEYRMEEID